MTDMHVDWSKTFLPYLVILLTQMSTYLPKNIFKCIIDYCAFKKNTFFNISPPYSSSLLYSVFALRLFKEY